MTWHYQATHRECDGADIYEVREAYTGPAAVGWTEDAMSPSGTTLEELVEDLAMMLADVVKYPVLEVD